MGGALHGVFRASHPGGDVALNYVNVRDYYTSHFFSQESQWKVGFGINHKVGSFLTFVRIVDHSQGTLNTMRKVGRE